MTSSAGKISIGLLIDGTGLAGELVAQIHNGLNPALSDVEKQVGDLAATLDKVGSGGLDGVIEAAKQAESAIEQTVTKVDKAKDSYSDASRATAEGIARTAEAAANIGDKVSDGLDKAVSKGRDLSRQMSETADSVGKLSKELDKYGPAGSFAGGVLDSAIKPATDVIDGFNYALDAVDKISGTVSAASELARGVSEGIREALAEDVGAIKDQLSDLPKSLSKVTEQSIGETVQMITEGVGRVGDAVGGFGTKISTGLSAVSTVGQSIVEDLRGATDAAGRFAESLGIDISGALDVVNGGLDGFSRGLGTLNTVASTIGGISTTIQGVGDAVRMIGDQLQKLPDNAQGLGAMFAPGSKGAKALPGLAAGAIFGSTPDVSNDVDNGAAIAGSMAGSAATGFMLGGPYGALAAVGAAGAVLLARSFWQSIQEENAVQEALKKPTPGTGDTHLPAVIGPTGAATGSPGTAVAPREDQMIPTTGPGSFRDLPALNPLGVDTSQSALDAIDAQVAKVRADIKSLGIGISEPIQGQIKINNPVPEVLAELEKINVKVETLKDGSVVVDADITPALSKFGELKAIGQAGVTVSVHGVISGIGGGGSGSVGGRSSGSSWFGNADGGVLPGFSPGVDDMLWPMSGGEGVLIPEVVRALGPGFVYSLNAMYRPGLRKGFADGGVNAPGVPSGMSPLASEIASGLAGVIAPVVGLLTQIRDNQTSIGTTTAGQSSGDKTTDQLKTGAGQLVGDAINAAGSTAGAVGADVIKAGLGTGTRTVDIPADTLKLMAEQNPAALFSALGYKVGDYSRTGGNGDDILANTNKISANGALYSDTAALVDRTLTSMEATADARQQQLLDVLGQIRDQLAELIGQVVTAVAKTASSSAGQAASQAIGGITGMASGGVLPGYSPGVDNLLVPMSGGEGVLIPEAVRGLGPGFVHGINAMFRGGRAGRGGVGYSSGGVVDVTQSVGADFFGLSQIPIIGTIVNALVGILLKIVGVEIESRNTLQEMGKDFRAFRGDFMAFDASGRIASDTSGLVDRDLSSKDVVNNERVRILTQVIVGVIKYVIEKVIKPIVDSVIQSAIQFGQQALNMGVSAGLNAMAPGAGAAGSMVSNFLSSMVGSAANAASQVGSEIVSQFASEGLSAIVSVIGQALPNGLFSLFDIGGLLTALFGGVAAGAAGGLGMLGGKIGTFDEGGIAGSAGWMPKNTIEPERVLSPGMTRSFDRFLAMLESGALNGSGSNTTTVHAPIHVQGQNAPTQIRSQLLELISV